MISKDLYQTISETYGHVCSWAVWAKAGNRPKSNISNMDIFDLKKNSSLPEILRTDVIMVALNFARKVEFEKPFKNFHSANPNAQDYRIRYAFEGTEYYGSYMTDIIKDFPMLSSKDVMIYLKAHPEVISLQLDNFRKEMKFIRSDRPMILAFGKQVYKILKKGLNEKEYSALIQLTHYSHQISKENYRADTHKRLGIKVG